MTNTPEKPPRTLLRTRGPRGKVTALLVAGAVAVGGVVTVQAVAGSNTFQHLTTEISHKGGWGQRRGMRFAEMTDAEIEKQVSRVVRHISIEIDATNEQEGKIIALVTAVAKDMKPMRAGMIASRDEMKALLLSEQIDREAMEKIRQERIAEMDEMSKNVIGALADVAEVLTLQQRQVLEERVRDFRKMFGGHRRGGRGWRHHEDRT